eukprot:bmy_17173T0
MADVNEGMETLQVHFTMDREEKKRLISYMVNAWNPKYKEELEYTLRQIQVCLWGQSGGMNRFSTTLNHPEYSSSQEEKIGLPASVDDLANQK